MLNAARHRHPGRAGVLVMRVWLEDAGPGPRFRVRMVGRSDLDGDAQDTASALTVEDAVAYVRDWLERFALSGR